MNLRLVQASLLIGLLHGSALLAADVAGALFRPVALTGWNADVVFENGKSSTASSFDRPNQRTNDYPLYAWFESGLDGHSDGLPASRRLTSAASSKLVFELQPYNTNNVLLLSAPRLTGTLTLVEPAAYRSLFLLLAAGGGDTAGSLQIHFADGSETEPVPFQAPDWWTGSEGKETKTPAVTGLGRSNGQEEFQYEEYGDNGFGLYQTEVDLKKLALDSRPIKSISFKKGRGGATIGIFAVSGESAKATGTNKGG